MRLNLIGECLLFYPSMLKRNMNRRTSGHDPSVKCYGSCRLTIRFLRVLSSLEWSKCHDVFEYFSLDDQEVGLQLRHSLSVYYKVNFQTNECDKTILMATVVFLRNHARLNSFASSTRAKFMLRFLSPFFRLSKQLPISAKFCQYTLPPFTVRTNGEIQKPAKLFWRDRSPAERSNETHFKPSGIAPLKPANWFWEPNCSK